MKNINQILIKLINEKSKDSTTERKLEITLKKYKYKLIGNLMTKSKIKTPLNVIL